MGTKKLNLIYALKNGRAVHVSEVESGLKCGCKCPACGEPLVAKKGTKMVNHFAHVSGSTCEYGYESSLHLAAKDIISKANSFTIPAVCLRFPKSYKRVELLSPAKRIIVDDVKCEYQYGGVIPDIVLFSGGKKLFVEIYVTHKVDEIKLNKLKEKNISTIQIDLSKCEKTITYDELSNILLNGSELKDWLYNEYSEKLLQRFYDSADKRTCVYHGRALHIDFCPIGVRYWKGKPYANYFNDCLYCDYCLSAYEENGILCSGRLRISEKNDFNIPLENRIPKRRHNNISSEETLVTGNCPICGGQLMRRKDKGGSFIGCINYSFCLYRVSPNLITSENDYSKH